jgi:hypothetical protein
LPDGERGRFAFKLPKSGAKTPLPGEDLEGSKNQSCPS